MINKDITECPHCGSNSGYYRKDQIRGSSTFYANYDGSEADNSTMYDYTWHVVGKYTYCADCDKRLFKVSKETK